MGCGRSSVATRKVASSISLSRGNGVLSALVAKCSRFLGPKGLPAPRAIPDRRVLPEPMDPRVLQARLDRVAPPAPRETEATWVRRALRDHLALTALLALPELRDPRAIRAMRDHRGYPVSDYPWGAS